ncbi:MAG TPA: hypothetical protein VGK00_02880 [Anaerolineales bacterium]|jgi:hypothetical protein
MAVIALVTANRVEVVETNIQMTLIAAVAISPGQAVKIDANGKFALADAAVGGANARAYGVAVGTKQVAAGMPVTAVRKGVLDGFTFPQAYDAALYLNDAAGSIGDAAGTVNVVMGRVIPGISELLGAAFAKLFFVDL